MKQQPYLTADEVLELLRKKVLPNFSPQQQQQLFNQLVSQDKLLRGNFKDPDNEIPILEQCANSLRSIGIHVFLKIQNDFYGNPSSFYFLAGESGRVYERLFDLLDRLEFLQLFIADYKNKLPREWVAEKKKIDEHIVVMAIQYMPFLEKAYLSCNRYNLIFWCSMCSDYADKVEAYLRRLEDMEKVANLAIL
jgi:uncharacterized protein YeeX (DUF496 family)